MKQIEEQASQESRISPQKSQELNLFGEKIGSKMKIVQTKSQEENKEH